MGFYVYRTDSRTVKGAEKMSELSHYIKLRSGLSGCNAKQFECDKYLDCESCLEDKIKEHDKQIRTDAIDEFAKKLIQTVTSMTTGFRVVGNIERIAKELKEQKK